MALPKPHDSLLFHLFAFEYVWLKKTHSLLPGCLCPVGSSRRFSRMVGSGKGMLQHCLLGVRVGGGVTSDIRRHFTPHCHLDGRIPVLLCGKQGLKVPRSRQQLSDDLPRQSITAPAMPSPARLPITADSIIATATLKSFPPVPPCPSALGNQISLPSARLPAFSFRKKEPGRGWSFFPVQQRLYFQL